MVAATGLNSPAWPLEEPASLLANNLSKEKSVSGSVKLCAVGLD